MALVACRECGAKVSDQAVACPQCGAKPKSGMGFGARLIIGGLVIWIVGTIIASSSSSPEPAKEAVAAAKPKVDPAEEARFQRAVLVATALKSSLRNPESLKWKGIYANEDASTVCLEYRAENGFGGMSIEQAIVVKGKVQTSGVAWNKHCVKKNVTSMREVQFAL